jgi:uncharacterized protein YggE
VKKGLLLAFSLVLLIITLGIVGCSDYFGTGSGTQDQSGTILSQQSIGIWVTGVGEITVVPDIAMLSLGVETQAATVVKAQQEAAQAMDTVMGVLAGFGIEDADIKTQFYSVQPVRRFDNGIETLNGYRVTNTVSVKIRNIDDTGNIIDNAVAAGGDNIRVNDISFTLDDPDEFNEEAREAAMADAESRAKQLADLGGVKLGMPSYINEYGGYIPPIVFREANMAPGFPVAETAISPGELEIQLTVQVVYSIS